MKKYTMKAIQKILGVSYPTLAEMVRLGEIGSVRMGKRNYIMEEHLQAYLDKASAVPVEEDKSIPLSVRVSRALVELGYDGTTLRERQLLDALAHVLAC